MNQGGAIMKSSGFDRAKIMELIPHRDPMLLVDEVTEMSPGADIRAKFFVNGDRDIFDGHFPNEPVLPGVYTVEIMAQASCVLLLSSERYAGNTPYFIGIDKVRFSRKIKPGDTLDIYSELVSERTEKAIATCHAEVRCDGEVACVGDLTLALRKPQPVS
jgi:3-hydroxyacyl-[acyl-carrier-protein] dehydratase